MNSIVMVVSILGMKLSVDLLICVVVWNMLISMLMVRIVSSIGVVIIISI